MQSPARRKLVVHMQTTLDNRIANAQGGLWEPFRFGDAELAYVSNAFQTADTWAMGRRTYEAIIPWWDRVAGSELPDDLAGVSAVTKAFASRLRSMTRIVFSTSLPPARDRVVWQADIAARLRALKHSPGGDVILSGGPGTIGPLAGEPGLVDEYMIVVHPLVLSAGARLFSELKVDLALRLLEAKAFDAGCVALRYAAVGDH